MARVITVSNQKGGVGKTTTALALATGLQRRGFRVLAVDLDPQANLSFSLGGKTEECPTAYEMLRGEVHPLYAIQRTASVDLVSSNIVLSGAELEFVGEGREFLLRRALASRVAISPLRDRYDYIVIDTPPALGVLTINAYAASDYVIIPMQADIFSLQGIAQLSESIERLREYCNPGLQMGGILLCRYDARTILGRRIRETAELIAAQMGTRLYRSRIRLSVAVQEAQTNQEILFDYSPRCGAAKDYTAFVDELLQEGI